MSVIVDRQKGMIRENKFSRVSLAIYLTSTVSDIPAREEWYHPSKSIRAISMTVQKTPQACSISWKPVNYCHCKARRRIGGTEEYRVEQSQSFTLYIFLCKLELMGAIDRQEAEWKWQWNFFLEHQTPEFWDRLISTRRMNCKRPCFQWRIEGFVTSLNWLFEQWYMFDAL